MNRLLLVCCALLGTMFSQQSPKEPAPAPTPLKEYSYPSDGFSMKFPYAPEPHTDSIRSYFKVWTIHLSQGAAISMRLKLDSEPCDVVLEKLRTWQKPRVCRLENFR